MESEYPVPGRSEQRNRQIAGHEIGHAFVTRALGNSVHLVTIARGNGFEGKCVRSGPPTSLVFEESPEEHTAEIISVCDRLARMTPELGSGRVADSELIARAQCCVTELLAGRVAEEILFPDHCSLGAHHDQVEAAAFARVAVAAEPATKALIDYCTAEARALLLANRDIVDALVKVLIERGTLSGDQVDEIISYGVAMRLAKIERQRRDDWHQRCESAARFIDHQ